MKQVFETLLACMDQGKHCMLVSVIGSEGSVPRRNKSHMLVTDEGRLCGTVGGGAVEGKSILLAKQALEERASMRESFELQEKAADGVGMICGGRVEIGFFFISPDDHAVYEVFAEAVRQYECGKNTWLMIHLDSCKASLCTEAGWLDASENVPMDMVCSSDVQRFEWNGSNYYSEKIVSDEKVWIFGGGHVAQALVPVLASVDFRCMVIEDREEFCEPGLFPGACEVRHIPASRWAEEITIGPRDYVCIMTRGHAYDLDCQAIAMRTQACYIGVIGSRRKKETVNARLKAMGFSDQDLARIHTPIGLEIGAVTPAEIAVSIAAQMIAHRASMRQNNCFKPCMG